MLGGTRGLGPHPQLVLRWPFSGGGLAGMDTRLSSGSVASDLQLS